MTDRKIVTCSNCGKDCSSHHLACDRDDGEWCPDCFDLTVCSQGVHGEGCATSVFSPTESEPIT